MSYNKEKRNVINSILYYIKNEASLEFTDLTVIRSFKQVYSNTVKVPILCVSTSSTRHQRLEIGDDILDSTYTVAFNIFAKSRVQAEDISDFVIDNMRIGCVYYTFSQASGNPTSYNKTANGRLILQDIITDMPLSFNDDYKDRFRHVIIITFKRSIL